MNLKSKDDRLAFFSVVGLILIAIILITVTAIVSIKNNENQETEILDTVVTEQMKTDNVINADTKSVKNDGDSTFIGNIKIGCSKSEFEKDYNSFIAQNYLLNGLKIEKHKAYFNDGKLVRLILMSNDYKLFISLGERLERTNAWCFFYKQKYKNIYKECFKHYESGISIEKDLFTIEVFDEITISDPPSSYDYDIKPEGEHTNKGQDNKLKELNKLLQQRARDIYNGLSGYEISYMSKKPIIVRSMIDIYDKYFIETEKNILKKEHDDMINKQKKKRTDAMKVI